MGKISKGATGGFSGKAESVVADNWRDVDPIRIARADLFSFLLQSRQSREQFFE